MSWRKPANRQLVEAIVDTFRDPPERSYERLSSIHPNDWAQTDFWIDASGLAFYFLDHARSLGIEDAIDPATLERLQQNLADNRLRSAGMFEEFVALNQAFSDKEICYANLKGFTLSPDSCPDPSLRYQLDFDFLVDPEDLATCRSLLEQDGYILTAATNKTWEFKAGGDRISSLKDRYKKKRQRSVELHFASDVTDDVYPKRDVRLNRLSTWGNPAHMFPALSAADQLIGQATHLLGHLRGEGTRPSWFLEYRRHVTKYREDETFWDSVRDLADTTPYASIAIGLSTLLASNLFGEFSTPDLDVWTCDVLPPNVRLWAERYGRRVVLGDPPGSKLYLFLEKELDQRHDAERSNVLVRLLPLHRAPKILHAGPQDTLYLRIHRSLMQIRFILYRLRFHLVEGMRYAIESVRWKRFLRRATSSEQLQS